MEMNVKIESPKIELTTPTHISTAVFLMYSDVVSLPFHFHHLKSLI